LSIKRSYEFMQRGTFSFTTLVLSTPKKAINKDQINADIDTKI